MFSELGRKPADSVCEPLSLYALINWLSRSAQLRPAGPAPTISTSVSSVSRSVLLMIKLECDGKGCAQAPIGAGKRLRYFGSGSLRESGDLILQERGQRSVRANLFL